MHTFPGTYIYVDPRGFSPEMRKDENGNEYIVIRHTDDHIYAVNKKLVQVEDKGEEE